MGFDSVYKSLQELFPQLDRRVLRAVAIEHNKDADAAVEAVLLEVIPFFTERSKPNSPLIGSLAFEESSSAVQNSDNKNGVSQQPLFNHNGVEECNVNVAESKLADQVRESCIKMNADVYSHGESVVLLDQILESSTLQIDKCLETCLETSSDNIPGQPRQDMEVDVIGRKDLGNEHECFDDCMDDFGLVTDQEAEQAKCSLDDESYADDSVSLTTHEHARSSSNVLPLSMEDMHGVDLKTTELSLSSDTALKMDSPINIVGSEDESSNSTLPKSGKIHINDGLEEIIADARKNKKTLFSRMESVIGMMKELESKELEAEQVKRDAALGGIDIKNKAADLEKMLTHAKAANEMHAGEVHGEKAILATELKELQSRVLSLSDERDKSLAVLDEMREALELRLVRVENEIKSAEEERIEKEKTALRELAEQELIMVKVVEESKILKQQAEDNAKLHEFLADRGHVVDVLQGEIAVICQDVRVLKEKFDENTPYSKSVSFSQTSCILASSGSSSSSLRRSITDLVESVSSEQQSDSLEEKLIFEDARNEVAASVSDDRKTLIDDGWDFFEDEFRNASTLS